MQPEAEEIENNIEKGEFTELKIDEDELLSELTEIIKILLDKTQWFKNVKIKNKKEEKKRFKELRDSQEKFKPHFEFEEYQYDKNQIFDLINQCREATDKIALTHLQKHDAKELTPEDLREFFKQILKEIELYVKLSANVEDEESWRKYSEEIWPMINQKRAEKSMEKLQNIQKTELEKNMGAEEVAEMFREELNRLGMDYKVETRDVGGCLNIPEEKTVVVAKGEKGDTRKYSREEAKMLTMHELFHAIRAYNGYKAGKKSGFPEILGLHTPFYDRAEEGGALYRETTTQTMYQNKEFDYHLRLNAAYKIAQTDNYQQEFQKTVEELIELGGSVDRSFYLVARNREALRHHIYQAGRNDWKNIENKDKMLVGKLNQKWADKFQKETGGMIQKPEITAKQIFNYQP
jgi:hypothetical protein